LGKRYSPEPNKTQYFSLDFQKYLKDSYRFETPHLKNWDIPLLSHSLCGKIITKFTMLSTSTLCLNTTFGIPIKIVTPNK
jgi:hypothetical protein